MLMVITGYIVAWREQGLSGKGELFVQWSPFDLLSCLGDWLAGSWMG